MQLFDMLRDGGRDNPLIIHEDSKNREIFVQVREGEGAGWRPPPYEPEGGGGADGGVCMRTRRGSPVARERPTTTG